MWEIEENTNFSSRPQSRCTTASRCCLARIEHLTPKFSAAKIWRSPLQTTCEIEVTWLIVRVILRGLHGELYNTTDPQGGGLQLHTCAWPPSQSADIFCTGDEVENRTECPNSTTRDKQHKPFSDLKYMRDTTTGYPQAPESQDGCIWNLQIKVVVNPYIHKFSALAPYSFSFKS